MFSSTKYLTWMSMQALHSIFFHPHFLWMALAAVDRALSTAERSCPTSEVRGRSREDAMPERWQPGGVTPTSEVRGQWPRVPGCYGAGMAGRSKPTRGQGGSPEKQLHVQGAVAAWAQEGLEKLSHVQDQEGLQ